MTPDNIDRDQRAILADKAQALTRKMLPFAPLLAEIVRTGNAETQQEQLLVGLAMEFALNILGLAMLVGARQAIEIVTSSGGAGGGDE